MKKVFLSIFIFVAVFSLFPNTTGYAQNDSGYAYQAESDTFTFAELREQEQRLLGPFATESILFGLPANWNLQDPAQLELDISIAIQASAQQAVNQIYGGSLTILMNRQIIAVIPVSQSGRFSQLIPIPLATLSSLRGDGRQEITFILSSSESCVYDQKMDITIHSSSRFILPHTITPPDTNLVNFPRPLYQDSIFPDSALIVIPDQPTASEMQAALTVAAGLQARTGDAMVVDVINNSNVTDTKLATNHLILVGNAASLPIFYQVPLPLNIVNNSFGSIGDTGVLQMAVSPWSPERVVLIVSGENDQATVKAAQALSTGVIRPNIAPNLAFVDSVNSQVYAEQATADQTLEGLGYESVTFEGRGETTESFQFYVPTGQTVTAEAYFEVSLSHSTLLNYARSGLFLILNEKPIGSIRFSDETANQSNNRIRVAIPPSAVRSGLNVLDISAALEPLDECADPNQTGLFVTVWADSRFYLPPAPVPVSSIQIPDLTSYPLPFVQSPDLAKTAFILEPNSLDAAISAIKIASNLGVTADGVIFTPEVFYANELTDVDLSSYNIIAIGIPSKMDFITNINDKLPAPFLAGSDSASEEELQVVYQIDPKQPAGYLQLLPSPWNLENLIVLVVGNSAQGLSWASDILLSTDARQALSGNFAVINDEQVISIDTRLLDLGTDNVPAPATPLAGDNSLATPIVNQPASSSTPSWVLIALIFTIVAIFVVIGLAFLTNKKK
jgi:hypothetical protein